MQNMSLQTTGPVDASLPWHYRSVYSGVRKRSGRGALPSLSQRRYGTEERSNDSGAVVSDHLGGGSGRVGHIQATSPKSWEKLCYVSPALVTGQASKHAAPSSSVVMFAARISPEHRLGGLGSFEAAHPLLSTCNSQCRAPQVSPGCRTLSLLPVAESREMEPQNHPHAARPRCLQGPRAAPVPAAPPGEN